MNDCALGVSSNDRYVNLCSALDRQASAEVLLRQSTKEKETEIQLESD